MRGLELAQEYYERFGRQMIHENYPEYESRIAVGLVGEGSECFGFDDSYSRDHDYGPAFCLWLNQADWKAIGGSLQRDYEQLPDCLDGFPARRDNEMTGHRIGVWETGEFYRHFLGVPGVPESLIAWLRLPDSYLAVATNGQVFRDEEGTFSRIRAQLKEGYPESVRIKKLVARAANMSQAGQYNYPRCINRGEVVAANLALSEFIRHGMAMIYLLNHSYAPFYKWMHRGLAALPRLGELQSLFTELSDDKKTARQKQDLIEAVCSAVTAELKKQGLVDGTDPFLQVHLEEMMSRIPEPEIRRLHWLEG